MNNTFLKMKLNTDKAYLLGLIIGGGILKNNTLQISLPYKKWGALKINPERGGNIAEDILLRAKPIWKSIYNIDISYKIDANWKIICESISKELRDDLDYLNLLNEGEFRYNANLKSLIPELSNIEFIKSFLAGIVDTVGSMASSHRRFTEQFQIVSLEFIGKNFELVEDIVKLLTKIGCLPDQILWNHPNQHSSLDRYYKSWKKGFKIRVALDDYMLNGSFIFQTKQLSATENQKLQKKLNSTTGKIFKIEGRTTLHVDEYSKWIPEKIRGYHFIHYLHLASFLGMPFASKFTNDMKHIEKYICPFTLLTKGKSKEIQKIIKNEEYLSKTKFNYQNCNIKKLLEQYNNNPQLLINGNTEKDGFMINLIIQGLAYIIAATKNDRIKGKRVLGSYKELINDHLDEVTNIRIGVPNKGTCLLFTNGKFSFLTGYINDSFNKKLITIKNKKYFKIRNPKFKECITLKHHAKK